MAHLVAVLMLRTLLVVHLPATKIPVFVDHTGTDPVGTTLAMSIREAIHRSPGFEAVSEKDFHVYSIVLLSVDTSPSGNTGLRSAVAVSYTMANLLPLDKKNPQTWLPIFLTGQVLDLGTDGVEGYGTNILAELDRQVEQYKELMKRSPGRH